MSESPRHLLTVLSGTLSSRVLGLVRTVLMATYLGLSTAAGAFIFAFTLPNLFRRFLGEGELNAAATPVLAEKLGTEGPRATFHLANGILTRVLILAVLATACLLLINFLGLFLLNFQLFSLEADKLTQWILGLRMGVLMAFYTPLICLTAVLAGLINLLGHFKLSSFLPVMMNLIMIATLLLTGSVFALEPEKVGWALAASVVLAGLLQLGGCGWALYRQGWRPRLSLESSAELEVFKGLFSVGLLAATITFLNTFLTRLFAFSLNAASISAINYAERLAQLPIGLFAVSTVTVFFPSLSRQFALREQESFRRGYQNARYFILLFTLPSAIGLAVLAKPILIALFKWGRFESEAVAFTAPLLSVYALSIPFYCASLLGFKVLQSMKKPRVYVGVLGKAFVVHVCFSLALLPSLGAMGLAIGNFLANLAQFFWARQALRAEGLRNGGGTTISVFKMLAAAVCMGALAMGTWKFLEGNLGASKVAAVLTCALIPLFFLAYLGLLRFICPRQRAFIDGHLRNAWGLFFKSGQ